MIERKTGKKPNINWGGKPYRQADVMYAVAEISKIDFWKPSISLDKGIKLYLSKKAEGND